MATRTVIRVSPLTATIGAVVEGVDLREPLDPETVAGVRRALLDNGVIFFHDQPLTRDQLKAFALNFGPIGADTPGPPAEEVSEMVTTEPKGASDIWHADATYMAKPNLGAVMRAVRLPPVGGDTCWASMYAAYDALSKPLREMLMASRRCIHWPPSYSACGDLVTSSMAISRKQPEVINPSTSIRSSACTPRPVASCYS
jgi:taurine dioxygenase